MRPLHEVHGIAAPYPRSNVDTDEIVPARFLLRDRKEGFAEFLFHDLRFDRTGAPIAAFVLNKPQFRAASVLIAGANFGCGSSREHAVWALRDYGFDAVIAPSFGDIFRSNAVQNGLLPLVLQQAAVDRLFDIHAKASVAVRIDLPAQAVFVDGRAFEFEIPAIDKERLMTGRSQIDETLGLRTEIESFERSYLAAFPWAAPR